VQAPAGYGKTTAVRDYLEKNLPHSADLFWFTAVDEAPVALYRRLCLEIEKIDSCGGKQLLKLGFPNAFIIGEICETLRLLECGQEMWLVIDNFQSMILLTVLNTQASWFPASPA
jgi:LuxR family maltose regulon positive regulatory protein